MVGVDVNCAILSLMMLKIAAKNMSDIICPENNNEDVSDVVEEITPPGTAEMIKSDDSIMSLVDLVNRGVGRYCIV